MRVVPKEDIRFAVTVDGGASAQLEIRLRRDRFGGWEASALLHEAGATTSIALGRVFRARDRTLTVDKIVTWVRRRYPDAQPLAERRSGTSRGVGRTGPTEATT